jgi:hypothetical protein
VERVGNAYRVTDMVNIPELQNKLQRRIDGHGDCEEVGWGRGFGFNRPAVI